MEEIIGRKSRKRRRGIRSRLGSALTPGWLWVILLASLLAGTLIVSIHGFLKSVYQHSDSSYRPQDLERAVKEHRDYLDRVKGLQEK